MTLKNNPSTISEEELFTFNSDTRLKFYLDFEQANLGVKQIEKLTGDASTRQYFRLFCTNGSTLIASIYQESFDQNTHPFSDVTKLFLMAKLPVPKIIAVSGRFAIMLMEDLGDTRLQDWLLRVSEEDYKNAYKEAISLIIDIQNATNLAYLQNSISSRLAFDQAKLMWELDFFYQHYFHSYLQVKLSSKEETALKTELEAIAKELSARPRVLCHRDFHSRNLMLYQGKQYIIDHQDARMGPESYDIASLLRDPYVELSEEMVEALYQFFVNKKLALGASQKWVEEMKQEFELMTLQRIVKAIGTYAYQTAVVKNNVYAPYIPRAIATVEGAAKRLGRFSNLLNMLKIAN
ncbi:MAG: phosphotransferase [Acidobacteria bacterium]|nr:phosphotransferase [Acidobacteriota bacterium]